MGTSALGRAAELHRPAGKSAAILAVWVLAAAPQAFAAGDSERPTPGGILRLVRDWQWCEASAAEAVTKAPPSLDGAAKVSQGPLDLNAMRELAKRDLQDCDRVIWRHFTVPAEWRGRRVYFTYDARRLENSGVCSVWLNGEGLPVALPLLQKGEGIRGVASLQTGQPQSSAPWFVDIGSQLRFDGPNIVALRVRHWPLQRSAGVWLYSSPEKEKVLFLQSADLSVRAQGMVRAYTGYVARHFAVEPLLETKSFRTPAQLREYLTGHCRAHAISGAVLIGSHPMQAFNYTPEDRGGCPRFFEDLDAKFSDTNGDGVPDLVEAPANFGAEIWTSWVRLVPDQTGLLEPYLHKVLGFYERRIHYPAAPIVYCEDTLPEPVKAGPGPGLDHVDRFTRPAFYTRVGAHGGTGHLVGPHLAVKPEEALQLYPGALVTRLSGCHGGDILRERITPAEAYLFGRSNSVVAFSSCRSEGGDSPTQQLGWQCELMNIAPHYGVFYSYLMGLRGCGHSSYLHTGAIMLGNPFVNIHQRLAAPSGTITGRVRAPAGGGPVEGFYVSATRDGKGFGRVMTGKDGTYELGCLPPGSYEVRLHLNALEWLSRKVLAAADKTTLQDWQMPRLWEVRGQVLDGQGKPDPLGWVEVAGRDDPSEFVGNDLFGLRTDDQGRFVCYGGKATTIWLRARSGRKFESQSVPLTLQPGQRLEGQQLQVALGALAQRVRMKADLNFLNCQQNVEIEVPSEDGLPPAVDVTGIYVGLVPETDTTLTDAKRGVPPEHLRDLGRALQTLRLAFELAEPLPEIPPGKGLHYFWNIMTGPEQEPPERGRVRRDAGGYSLSLRYMHAADKWRSAPDVFGPPQRPAFWVSAPVVSGPWLIVDINPFAGHELVDWRLTLSATSRLEGEDRGVKRVPLRGCFRLRANLGDRPSLCFGPDEPGAE